MPRPNLLLVIADEWRAHALGLHGTDPVHTPHLDAFAAGARRLTRAVSNYPVCSPYRGMLMTGQYPHRNGVTRNCNSTSRTRLATDARCWSDVLADDGYRTGYVGKWHLEAPPTDPAEQRLVGFGTTEEEAVVWDAWTPPGPRRHGFDFWYAYNTFDDHRHPHYWTGNDTTLADRVDIDDWSPRHETDVALDFLPAAAGAQDAPFALVVSYNPPHMPFDLAPEQYREPYRDLTDDQLLNRPNVPADSEAGRRARDSARGYFASVTAVDDEIGRLLAGLEDRGLADDTVVLITSDHGEMLGSHGLMSKNTWHDESLLVPFLLRMPGTVPPGGDDLLLSVPDIYPTLLGLLGLADRTPPEVQGRDLSAALRGEPGADRPAEALYFRDDDDTLATSRRGLRTGRHTLVIERRPGEPEHTVLHDNAADPYQLHNAAAEQPAVVAELTDRLHAALARIDDPWPPAALER